MLVHGNEQRSQRFEVHQDVVDDDAARTEIVVQFVAEHHAVHAAEGMVRGEKVAPVEGKAFEAHGTVGDLHVVERRTDESDRRLVRETPQHVIDFVLMHDPLEVGLDKTGQQARQTWIFVCEHLVHIHLQGIVRFHSCDTCSCKGRILPFYPQKSGNFYTFTTDFSSCPV